MQKGGKVMEQQEMLVKILQMTEETNTIVKDLQQRVTVLEQRVSKLEKDVADLKDDMAYMKVEMSYIRHGMEALDKKMDYLEAKSEKNMKDVAFHNRILFKNLDTVMNTLNLKMTLDI